MNDDQKHQLKELLSNGSALLEAMREFPRRALRFFLLEIFSLLWPPQDPGAESGSGINSEYCRNLSLQAFVSCLAPFKFVS